MMCMWKRYLKSILYLILRKKNWLLPCLCDSLGLNSVFLSLLDQGATINPYMSGLQESNLILPLTCQPTGEKGSDLVSVL